MSSEPTLAEVYEHLSESDRDRIFELLMERSGGRYIRRPYFHKGLLPFVPISEILQIIGNYPRSKRLREAQERMAPESITESIRRIDQSWYDKIISILGPIGLPSQTRYW